MLRHILNEMIDDIIRGVDVGGTSSIIKVFYTELLYKLMRQVTDLQGVARAARRSRCSRAPDGRPASG